jgi:hypothetical protein
MIMGHNMQHFVCAALLQQLAADLSRVLPVFHRSIGMSEMANYVVSNV